MTSVAPSQAGAVHTRCTCTPINTPAFFSVAEVLLGTASTPATPIRGFAALRRMYATLRRPRVPRATYPPRRSDYFERAAMGREMHCL